MEFPDDLWNMIMTYFHSSYKKPLHYEAFKTIKLYKDFKNSEKKLWYIDDFDNLNVIENTLYRYILDDYSFCRSIVLLDTGKWNPFMSRYCWLILLLNMGDAKSQRLWNSNYHYNRVIVEDFKIIIRNLNVPLSKNSIQY